MGMAANRVSRATPARGRVFTRLGPSSTKWLTAIHFNCVFNKSSFGEVSQAVGVRIEVSHAISIIMSEPD